MQVSAAYSVLVTPFHLNNGCHVVLRIAGLVQVPMHGHNELLRISQCVTNSPGAALQGLHSVAYTGGLAKPLVAPPGVAARLTPPVLADFIANNYGAQRMVLAGEHALLRGALPDSAAA